MKREAEDPAGHLLTPYPSVFEPGNLGESTCNYDVFVIGWFVVVPFHSPQATTLVPRIEYAVDCDKREGSEVADSAMQLEESSVSLVGVLNDPRHRMFSRKVGKQVETTQARRHCKLPPLFSESRCASHVIDIDATQEDIEAIYHEGRVEVIRCRCCEIF